MRIGEEIFHPAFGRGIVVEVGARGAHPGAVVDFGYMKSWVTAAEAGQDSAAAASVPAPDPRALHGMPDAVVKARRGVLALRLGQILESDVRELSAGTESVEAEMETLVSCATKGRAGSESRRPAPSRITLHDAIPFDAAMALSMVSK